MHRGEYRLFRVTIYIKKVSINLKTPSFLIFQLSNDANCIQSSKKYEVKNGNCTPNQKLTIEVQILFSQNKYVDKNINLIMFMKSGSGKIPTGSVMVNLTQNGSINENRSENYTLLRCPDKEAKLTLTKKLDLIKTLRTVQSIESELKNQKVKNLLMKSKDLRMMTSASQKQFLKKFSKNNSKADLTTKYSSPTHKKAILQKWSSAKTLFPLTHEQNIKKQRVIESHFTYNEENDFTLIDDDLLNKQRISIENEKLKYKNERSTPARKTHNEEATKYLNETIRLSEDMETLKDKIKNYEKKQKQLTNFNQNLEQEVEKLKSKNNHHQLKGMEYEFALEQKNKMIKKLNSQLKKILQEVQDLKINKAAQEKKYDLKQHSWKEQLQKLTEKFQKSEMQCQSYLHQLNDKIYETAQIQKKYQVQLKQKQKAFLDEKYTLQKKIQGIMKNYEQADEKKQQYQSQFSKVTLSLGNLTKKFEEKDSLTNQLQEEKLKLQIEIKKLNEKLFKNGIQCKQLQQSLEGSMILKKEHRLLFEECENGKKVIKQQEMRIKVLEHRVRQMENTIQQFDEENNILNSKMVSFVRDLEINQRTIENKEEEIDSLSSFVQSSTIQLNQIKIKNENEYIKSQEMRKRLIEELNYLKKQKQKVQSQYHELNWQYEKLKDNFEALQSKFNYSNQNILNMTQQIMLAQEKNNKLNENIKQTENSLIVIKHEKQLFQVKQRQLIQKLKLKNNQIFQLSRRYQEREQEIISINEKTKELQQGLNQNGKQNLELLKKKEKENEELKFKIKKLQLNELQIREKSFSLENQIRLKRQQISYYKEGENRNKESQKVIQNEKNLLSNELFEVKKNVTQLNHKIQNSNENLKKKEEELISLKSEFENFKEKNFQSIEAFAVQVNKQTQCKNFTFDSPDLRLTYLYTQILRKKNLTIEKHQESLRQNEENRKRLNVDIEKTKKMYRDREEEIESFLNQYKEKNIFLQKDFMQQKQKLFQQIKNLEEKVSDSNCEIQRLKNENKNVKLHLNDFQVEGEKLSSENQTYQKQLQTLEKKIKEIEKNRIIEISQKEKDFNCELEERKTEIEKHKNTIIILEKKVKTNQFLLSQKEECLQKKQNQKLTLLQQKGKVINSLYMEEKKNQGLLKKIERLEEQKQSLDEKVNKKLKIEEKMNEEIGTEKVKYEDIKLKLIKANQSLFERTSQIQNLSQELQILNSKSLELSQEGKKSQKSYKTQMMKLNDENVALKETIISLKSQNELKGFLVIQYEETLQNIKTEEERLLKQISEKKTEILNLDNRVSELEGILMSVEEQKNFFKRQKQNIEEQYKILNIKFQQTGRQLFDHQLTLDKYANKQKQFQGSKSQVKQIIHDNHHATFDLKQTISKLKQQLSIKGAKEEELRKKIRQQEKIIENQSYELQTMAKQCRNETERQKIEFVNDLEEIQRQNNHTKKQYELRQEKYVKQIENLKGKIQSLVSDRAKKDQMIRNKEKEITENENKVKHIMKSYLFEKIPGQTDSQLRQFQKEKSEGFRSNLLGNSQQKFPDAYN